VFGFYPNKQLTTGEGGMAVTDDPRWAALFRSLRNQGRGDDGGWLRHERLGFNYRLDEMSAALGVAQLRRFDALMADRGRVAALYTERLADVAGVRLLAAQADTTVSWFVYAVRVDDLDRDALIEGLGARGVPSRAYFPTIHLQPLYRERFGFRPGAYPVAEAAAASLVALPFHGRMTEADVDRVGDALAEAIAGMRPRSRAGVA
jgi:perosamine synthetase